MEPRVVHGKVDEQETETVKVTPNPRAPRSLFVMIIVILIVVLALLAAGILPRLKREVELTTAQTAVIHDVATVPSSVVRAAAGVQNLDLPGNIEPIQEISVYARTSGYMQDRFADIGDHVHTNQELMRISSPEVDKQLASARADLKQAQAQVSSARADLKQAVAALQTAKANVKQIQANLVFSRAEVERYTGLAKEGAVSYEMRDQKQRDVDADIAGLESAQSTVTTAESQISVYRERITVAEATVETKRAEVERLQSLVSFQKVISPCDGVITSSNVDPGALITPGSATSNVELMRIARTDVLRVFVYVPQSFYQSVHTGDTATVTVSEMPGREFTGTVARVSGGMDSASRTLKTEVHVPNPDQKLLPGMYAQVKLTARRSAIPMMVPSSALVVRSDGQYVPILDDKNHIHYTKVVLGRDFGAELEITSGLQPGQRVVLDATDDIQEGEVVNPHPSALQAGDAKAANKPAGH